MVKFQFFGLKSFVMGFKLKEIVFYSLFTRYSITKFLDYALSLMRSPYITVYFCHFWQAQTRRLDGETCFNFTTTWGCIIVTNYIDFSFPSSFCRRGVISLRHPKLVLTLQWRMRSSCQSMHSSKWHLGFWRSISVTVKHNHNMETV